MFVVRCQDKPGQLQVRLDNRAAHLAHLDAHAAQVVLAGPLLDAAGEAMVGSLLVLDFPDRAGLDAFLAADPYAKAGLFASVEVSRFKRARP